jgi:hypothetical protein
MLSLGWIIGISIYVIYSLIIFIMVMKTYKTLSFMNKPDVVHSSQFPGFTRDDYSKWSKFKLVTGGLFLLPIRLFAAIAMLICLYIVMNILSFVFCNFSFRRGINPCHKFFVNTFVMFACRFILFLGGFYWISYKTQKPMPYNIDYFENQGEVPHATYVSNHITWVDIVFFLAHPKSFGFISNHVVRDYCFIGKIAELLQCIFVNRRSPESKQKCFKDLKERGEHLKKDPKCNFLF